MEHPRFFLPGAAPSRAYENIRDKRVGPATAGRAFVEQLWSRYRGLEDSHFRRDAKAHFQERFWEMYLGVTLRERGLKPVRQSDVGPDFLCSHRGQSIWLEATAPGPGNGDDRVEAPVLGVAYTVPTEKILLRFTHAFREKGRKHQKDIAKGLEPANNAFVIAINSRQIPHAPYGNSLPFFVQAFLPIGAPTVVLSKTTGKAVDSFYAFRNSVAKATGASVCTADFLDPAYAFVSAVLHSGADCVNHSRALGDDFAVLHNPRAVHPLEHSMFAWCDQYVFEADQLVLLPRP